MDPVLWSIKYQPKTWDEFFGQEEAIRQLQNYISSTTIPHFIFIGPSGTGKTLAANLFAKEILRDAYATNFKSLNIRDIRSYSISDAKRNMGALAKIDRSKRTEMDEYMSVVFREAKAARKAKGVSRDPNRSQLLHQAIHLFASTITISDDLVKLLVLDESEALDSNMLNALRRTMEIYSQTCRFILVTSSVAGWNPAIASRSIVIKFPSLKDEDIAGYLTKISEAENVAIDSLGMNSIIRESGGDMRRAVDLLQICA
ncbi:MAG: AAA family ATPase, partial [Candidatus Thorarchaeota archaeon]|nr:AAA family ATPase [Candidatus Thorarchaeota archaeon]